MKKTLLVTLEYPPDIGGVASYYSNLVSQLPSNDVVVLTNKHQALLPWRKSFGAIIRAMRKHSVKTILVGQVLPLGTVVACLSYIYPVRFIVFIHGMDIAVPQQFWRKRILIKWIIKRASHVITVSQYTASKISQYTNTQTPISIIHPAAHITPAVLTKTIERKFEVPFILSVGRLVERKGFDKAIEAFAKIHSSFPNVQYIIAGSGSYEPTLRSLISKYRLEEKIQLTPNLSDAEIAQLYAECEYVVMPARTVNEVDFEGYGITVLEANTFGKPVIGGLNSGMTDAIEPNKTGWLVDGTNVEDIAAAMKQALENTEQRHNYGEAARLRANDPSLSWLHKAKKLEHIIESVGEPKG